MIQRLRHLGPASAGLLALLWCVLVGGIARSQVPQAPDRFGALLAAGEFAAARNEALRAEPVTRDLMLARLAGAQAGSGARSSSYDTIAAIQGDGARRDAIQGLGGMPVGARGGAAMADFDSLIELVTSTIAPETWDEVGGPGAIEPFPGGVLVDASGLLTRRTTTEGAAPLTETRRFALRSGGNRDVAAESRLRKVSLRRLEHALELAAAEGRSPDDAMQVLAGIYKVQYVLLYPDTGDIVIAGPAGDWRRDGEGRVIHVGTSRPTLRLDDLVVMLRNARRDDPTFGCNITPATDRLAATRSLLESKPKLSPGEGPRFREQLRSTLGKQAIEVFGIDPRTRAARVLVEADYRMKLVGMGLEPGVAGVKSYLDTLTVGADGNPPPMSVLRWWFTLNYDAIKATPAHDAFELCGQGVQVLSENELLTRGGERVHTGASNEPTALFAHSFTRHFDAMCDKYPLYAELRNIFDLALVSQLLVVEDVSGRFDWPMGHLLDEQGYQIELAEAPREVETVVNHRLVNGKHIVTGLSGGVRADLRTVVRRDEFQSDNYDDLAAERSQGGQPRRLAPTAWWWD